MSDHKHPLSERPERWPVVLYWNHGSWANHANLHYEKGFDEMMEAFERCESDTSKDWWIYAEEGEQ